MILHSESQIVKIICPTSFFLVFREGMVVNHLQISFILCRIKDIKAILNRIKAILMIEKACILSFCIDMDVVFSFFLNV